MNNCTDLIHFESFLEMSFFNMLTRYTLNDNY